MIYIAQLIYVQPGKEKEFLAFEANVLPLLKEHDGKIVQRIRPTEESFIEGESNKPYEVHVVTFPDSSALKAYSEDPRRTLFLALKEQSIEAILMIQQST